MHAGVGAMPIAARGWLVLGLSAGLFGLFLANQFGFSVTVHWVFLTMFAPLLLNIFHEKDFSEIPIRLNIFAKVGIFVVVAIGGGWLFLVHDVAMISADAHMRNGYDAVAAGDLVTTAQEYGTATDLAPVEPFYALNLAYAQLQRIQEGQNVSAVEKAAAIDHAFHAARLRGYDGFSLSVGRELANGSSFDDGM